MKDHLNNNPHIAEHLAILNKKDTWSLLLFALYKLRDDPDWLTLSELSYILESDDLVRFLSYFEGLTITIPKLRDLRLMLATFTVYRLTAFEGIDLDAAIKGLNSDEFSKDEIKQTYLKVLNVVRDYEFNN